MLGFNSGRRGLRFPFVVALALAGLLLFLAFNCWDLSRKRARLLDELAEAQAQSRRVDAARGRLEKRNAELLAQVDAHLKEADKRQRDYEAVEAQSKKCSDEKMKIQSESQAHVSQIERLKEQLKELRDEFLKQENQLHDMRNNNTLLQKKLEDDSLQCKQQLILLKQVHAEQKKSLEEELVKLRKHLLDKGVAAVDKPIEHPEDTRNQQNALNLRDPNRHVRDTGIEENRTGKLGDPQFALKKPAITQMRFQAHETGIVPKSEAGFHGHELNLPRDDVNAQGEKELLHPPVESKMARDAGIGGQNEALDKMKADSINVKNEELQMPPNPIKVQDKPVENNVAKNMHPAEVPQHDQNKVEEPMEHHAADLKRHQAMDML